MWIRSCHTMQGWDLGATVQGKQWTVSFCNGDVTTVPRPTRLSSCKFLHMPYLVHLGRSCVVLIRWSLSLTTKNQTKPTIMLLTHCISITLHACLWLKFYWSEQSSGAHILHSNLCCQAAVGRAEDGAENQNTMQKEFQNTVEGWKKSHA